MRIMTTNIWGDYFNNPVEVRKDNIYKIYENYKPDIIGFQEVRDSWYNSGLFEKLSDEYYLVGKQQFEQPFEYQNFCPIALKKNYRLLAQGVESLADSPGDVSKVITWAVVADKDDEKVFGVCNTHFWWMTGKDEYDFWRCKNAKQLSSLMKYISKRFDCPVFAFGDMNCRCTSNVFKSVYPLEGVKQLYELAEKKDDVGSHHGDPVADENGNFHGVRSGLDHTYSIDHMVSFGNGFKALEYRIVEDQYALDATDHSPVYVDIELD